MRLCGIMLDYAGKNADRKKESIRLDVFGKETVTQTCLNNSTSVSHSLGWFPSIPDRHRKPMGACSRTQRFRQNVAKKNWHFES